MKTLLVAAFCLATGLTLGGRSTDPSKQSFEKEVVYRGEFLLALPDAYEEDESKDWPLLVFLHGAGERGDDVERVAIHWPVRISGQGGDFPFVVAAPLCPKGRIWSPEHVLALIDDVVERHRIDEDRIYLTGLSMGGFGTWATAARAPERFAAIAPVCGGAAFIEGWHVRKQLPVWAFHGADDRVVPPDESRRMIEAIERHGGEARLTIYEDVGHGAWNEAYAEDELWTWLLSHRRNDDAQPSAPAPEAAEPAPFDASEAVQQGCAILLEMQEEIEPGTGQREWPYEGVYRTNEGDRRRVIPIGYRVGGTAICCLALIESPGYTEDAERRAAVGRGTEFVLDALALPLMQPSTEDRYDVRGWGHIYALLYLLRAVDRAAVPEHLTERATSAIPWLIRALETQAIPERGGWSYAGRRAPSPFMTAPALQALFHASARGHDASEAVIDAALGALERGRAKSGSIAYATPERARGEVAEEQLRFMDKLPGAIARMTAVESTLLVAGRGSQSRLRDAVEAFFTHWEELEKRRQQTGTHVRPYGVAPYYFIYGHYYAAQAIELIDDEVLRDHQRERFFAIMAKVREEGGGWNDRIFPRSRNYGTAMGMMAVMMRALPRPEAWPPTELKKD